MSGGREGEGTKSIRLGRWQDDVQIGSAMKKNQSSDHWLRLYHVRSFYQCAVFYVRGLDRP